MTDAVMFGSWAHRLRSFWTNSFHAQWYEFLERRVPIINRRLQDILLPIHVAGQAQSGDVYLEEQYKRNVKGEDRAVFPTFTRTYNTYSMRQVGHDKGTASGLVLNMLTGEMEPPWAEERELAMGFHIRDTEVPGLTNVERCELIGNAMDRFTLRWMLSISRLAIHFRHAMPQKSLEWSP